MIFDSRSLEKKENLRTLLNTVICSQSNQSYLKGNFYAVNVCIIYGKKNISTL